ncbi:hypothetical protein Nepgr_028743 [Nepenthes gracilis]|uniref:C2H2-type domain-containing protein n=1 Tax=Nepenthes gracilis TaxID=150966 RepID=A0AAD3TAY3_NEPGR|nr:hypothetical protein Nepgr_028743 [Nepenthes gracilis]
MPTIWIALKKSLNCRSKASEVYEPTRNNFFRKTQRKFKSNLKGAIHGSKRQREKSTIYSPSAELLSRPRHHELKITTKLGGGVFQANGGGRGGGGSAFAGSLTAGSLGPEKSVYCLNLTRLGHGEFDSSFGSVFRIGYSDHKILTCPQCGESLARRVAAEDHHLSKHAVTELIEGDLSRKIVMQIFKTGWPSSQGCRQIQRILKIHNLQTTMADFEEYRATVIIRATKLPNSHHPRCLADGNELLRFYGTTVACRLGQNGSSGLCTLANCHACDILRHGFSSKKILSNSLLGVFTTSSSHGAYKYSEMNKEDPRLKRALIVCRVVAGRVKKDDFSDMERWPGFDSVAGKVGPFSSIEELYVLSPRALLPCFLIVCKP